ncbi:MAG: GNAT family N-acetyltransferase [Deltaproteobacteria bacterium]|nr:GNAT family N-acetyltransferase [Deltaproteobacteria bacterium]
MELKIHRSLQEIPREAWNALAMGDFPFAEYDYLLAMEMGDCVGLAPGWVPYYPTLWEEGRLIGATFLYLKDNSYGEFIFDFAWARAYAQNGLNYYPKTVSASPFTPVTGPKLLIHPRSDREQVGEGLIEASLELSRREGGSGLHFLYITEAEIPIFRGCGALIRHSYQFEWENRGYRDFSEFLAGMRRKRRVQIARERRRVAELPIEIFVLSGAEVRPEHIAAMYRFYVATFHKKFCTPYLSRRFFEEVHARLKDKLVLILAKQGEEWVAGSINYRKGSVLYGRYWGCTEEYRNLHFELCYYQTIDYAIREGLSRVDAGAGGNHKMLRGFRPEKTYSAHWIAHPGFRAGIAEFIEREKLLIEEEFAYAREHDSFRPDTELGGESQEKEE